MGDDLHGSLTTPCSDNFEFKENAFMTNYKGYWIQKSRVKFVGGMYHKFYRRVLANEDLKNDDQRQRELERLTKKFLRNEHRILKLRIVKEKSQSVKSISPKTCSEGGLTKKYREKKDILKKPDHDNSKVNTFGQFPPKTKPQGEFLKKHAQMDRMKKKPGKYLDINYTDDPDIVKYEGFFIHRKSVDMLKKVKENLVQKGLSDEDLYKSLRKECRKAERLVKRDKKPKVQHQCKNINLKPKGIQDKTLLNPEISITHISQGKYPKQSLKMKPRIHVVFDD